MRRLLFVSAILFMSLSLTFPLKLYAGQCITGTPATGYQLLTLTGTFEGSTVSLQWNAVPGASSYVVKFFDNAAKNIIANTSTGNTQITLQGTYNAINMSTFQTTTLKIEEGKTYTFTVEATIGETTYQGVVDCVLPSGPTTTTTTTVPTTTTTTVPTTTTTTVPTTTTTTVPTTTTTTTTVPTTTTTTVPTTTTTTTVTTTTTTTTTTTLPPLPTCSEIEATKAKANKFDVNGDGNVDASDAALIIRCLKLNCNCK